MRGKRSKQYRRLIEQYARGFGFREPYQVLVDSEMVKDTHRFTMDLTKRLSQVLHGKVKPIICQCSIRHLYDQAKDTPSLSSVIEVAKTLERRRCGHHPDDYPEPLPERDCILSVVGARNKHRYVVATQDQRLRGELREVPGVPLVYVNRSVMILEPMAAGTAEVLDKGERGKFRGELRGKRKRELEEDEEREEAGEDGEGDGGEQPAVAQEKKPKKKRRYGAAKGPNPLAVKKKKKRPPNEGVASQ